MERVRLDRALVDRGLVSSRTKAQRLIASGHVSVAGVVELKASREVGNEDLIELGSLDTDVGRGAQKLRYGMEHLGLSAEGRICVDLGASTGGFSQVLLESGAKKVVAIDVGHDQLHQSLRDHPKLVNIERISVLDITSDWWTGQGLPPQVDLVVADLSFISLTTALPPVIKAFGVHSDYVVLVKPQFEVGRGRTDRGIVKDARLRLKVLREVADVCQRQGLTVHNVVVSPVSGEKGNIEYLMHASALTELHPAEWDGIVSDDTGGG